MTTVNADRIARQPEIDKDITSSNIASGIHLGTGILRSTCVTPSFTYYPKAMGNDQPDCKLFTGIEIKTSAVVNTDELEVLFKTIVDTFMGSMDTMDDAKLNKLEKTIEHVYNDLHVNETIKIKSIQLVKKDTVTDELRYRVMQLDCPACHQKTKIVLPWDVVKSFSNNPSPIAKILLKKDKTGCGHCFITFVDRDLKVKGYEMVDM